MRKSKRFLSLFLALLLTASLFPQTVLADEFFDYYDEDGECQTGFLCHNCDEEYTNGEDYYYCPDDDYVYCEDCICSTCNRCQEHCICEAATEDPVTFNDEDLTLPELPELPEFPEFSSDLLDELEDLLDEAREGLSTEYKLDHYEDGSIHAHTWNLFDMLCGKDNETECINYLWKSTGYKEVVQKNDSTFANSKVASETAKFATRLSSDPKIISMLNGGLKWSDKTTIDNKYADLNSLLDLLKKHAKAAGYSEESLKKLKLTHVNAANFADMAFSPVMEGNYTDDVRPYHYEIKVPEKTLNTKTSAAYQVMLFIHEFQHFLRAVDIETVYDLSVGELTLSYKTDASAIRYYLAHNNYSSPDPTYANSNVDAEFSQYMNSLMVYYSQLDERTANQTMNMLYEAYKPEEGDLAMFVFEKFGFEIMPVAIGHLNSKTFDEKGLSYLSEMAKLVPELGLIPTDFDLTKLELIDDGDRELLDYNGGDAKNGPGADLLFRYFAADGTNYVLPTKAFFDWVTEKTGKEPFNWEAMISATVGPSGKKRIRAKKEDVSDIQNYDILGKMPADLYEYYQMIALMVAMDNQCNGDENLRAEMVGRLTALMDEADTLNSSLECMDSLDSLSFDLESYGSDAERYSDELEDLAEQYDNLSFDLELLYSEAEWLAEDYADELNDIYHETLDTDDELEQSPEELAQELQDDYERRIEELQENIDDAVAELEALAEEIEELVDLLDEIVEQIDSLRSEIDDLEEQFQSISYDLEDVLDEIDALYALLDNVPVSATGNQEEFGVEERPDLLLSVTVTDTTGEPLSGIAVYYSLPGSQEHRLLGKTDTQGIAEGVVEDIHNYHAWKLSAGLGKAVKDDAGNWYLVPEEKTELFYVENDEDELIYVIREEFQLKKSDLNGDVLSAGGLRVVIRDTDTDEAELVNPEYYTSAGMVPRTDMVCWTDYYDAMMSRDNYVHNENFILKFWKKYMTESMSIWYGAWLLPLSDDGQLIRQGAERKFAPLYKWENGKAVCLLEEDDTFCTWSPDNPNPFVSYAFDFGAVPAGHYELAVVLPNNKVNFQEVTILSGKTETIRAQDWVDVDQREKPLRKIRLRPKVQLLGSDQTDWIEEGETPFFALSVDNSGRQVWSLVTFDNQSKPCVFVPVTYKRGYEQTEYSDEVESFEGQIYLAYWNTDLRLLPITYQYHYLPTKSGRSREYRGTIVGPTYGLSQYDNAPYKPTYVEFVEAYYDSDLKVHYRPVKDTVDFELHWDLDWDEFPEHWMSLCETRPDFSVSQNHMGIMQNYLFRRNVGAGEGLSYSFRYGRTETNYAADSLPSVLTETNPNTRDSTAELLSLRDTLWTKSGVPAGLTGVARMTTKEIRGADGKKVRLTAQCETINTNTSTLIRFVFRPSCREYGHLWAQSGNTVYCSRCGSTNVQEMPQIIEYVVPEGVTVEDPPLGWYVEGLPCPSGTPNGMDCAFAGWSEKPIADPSKKPEMYDDADEYLAPLRMKSGEYSKVKLYAVFTMEGSVRMNREPITWDGNYAFVLENVHNYENFGNSKTTELLTENHLNQVTQYDYCLTLSGGSVTMRPSTNIVQNALTVTGNSREGFKIGTTALTSAPAFLRSQNGKLSSDGTGSLFDIYINALGEVALRSREDLHFVAIDGFTPYAQNGTSYRMGLFWIGHLYFCTGEELPTQKELIFGQVPLQNEYFEDDAPDSTGSVAAIVETRGGHLVSITDVTDKINYFSMFYNSTPYYRASYNDRASGSYLFAYIPVTVVNDDYIPDLSYSLQLGGTWQSHFIVGKNSFNHDGQKVYLLSCDKDKVFDARCITDDSNHSNAHPVWVFDIDIQQSLQLPDGTYSVPVHAISFSGSYNSINPKFIASTSYNIHLKNTPIRHFPGAELRPGREVSKDWLDEHFVDGNIRHKLEQLLVDQGWNNRTDLFLEGLGIHDIDGVEDIPDLRDLWVRDNSLTQIEPESVVNLDVLVAGKQNAKIKVERNGNILSTSLSRVVSQKNLSYVKNVTALNNNGVEMTSTYQRENGRLTIQNAPRRKGIDEEITIRYEYEVPYGNGKTALMTVYLTPSEITNSELPDNTASFTPYLQNIVTGTERNDSFRFLLMQEGCETGTILTVSGSGFGAFEPISFEDAGIYQCSICMLPDETLPYHYDSRIYTARVEADQNCHISSIEWFCDDHPVEFPLFCSSWQTNPDTVQIEVRSEFFGYPPAESEEMRWHIEPKTVGAPNPTADIISAVGGNPADFTICCTNEGTWEYQVTQLPGSNPYGTYDEAVYSIIVTAQSTEKGIEAAISKILRIPDLPEYPCELVFQNQYSDPREKPNTSKACPSKDFTDVPAKGDWAHEGIDYCIANEFMNGVGNNAFNPKGNVTRAQLVTILYRIAGSPEIEFKGSFSDVPSGKWYSDPIEWAAANGIVNGTAPGKFNPMGNITREQIAAILYRYEGSPAVSGSLSAFPDNGKVHSYAESALIWATGKGLINGIASGRVTNLAPQSNATRAQIASIIMRFQKGNYVCS